MLIHVTILNSYSDDELIAYLRTHNDGDPVINNLCDRLEKAAGVNDDLREAENEGYNEGICQTATPVEETINWLTNEVERLNDGLRQLRERIRPRAGY
jgi:hypothetical protein